MKLVALAAVLAFPAACASTGASPQPAPAASASPAAPATPTAPATASPAAPSAPATSEAAPTTPAAPTTTPPAPAATPPAPTAPSAPSTSAPAAPSASACRATGAPLFEIHREVEPGTKQPTSTTRLYASGAWITEGKDATGKALPASHGCLGAAAAREVRAELDAAPWKLTHHRFHCMAYSASYTVYVLRGKQVYKARLCSPDTIDAQSQKALDDVEHRLGGKP